MGGRGAKSSIANRTSSSLSKINTVEGMKKYLADNIAKNVNIDFKNADIETMKEIAGLLEERMKEYGLEKFDSIINNKNSNALASVEDDVLKLNVSKLKNNKTVVKRLRDYESRYGFRFSVLANDKDVIRSTIDHELGHVLLDNSGYRKKTEVSRRLFDEGNVSILRGKNNPVRINKILGHYATTERHEFVAELITAYKHPSERKKLPKEYSDFASDLIKGMKDRRR